MRKRITKDQISAPLTRTQVSELASPQSSIESPRPSIGQTGAYVQDSFDDSVSQRDNGHEQATASEEVFTLHAFKGLQQAIGAHRRQVQALAGATDALVQQLESVRDCCSNPSQSRHRALVEQSAAAWPVQMDLLLQTSQISANTLAHLSSRIKADIEEPLEKIQQDIVINAELSRERNTAKMVLLRDGIRKEEVYSLKMGRKKGAGDGSHDLKKVYLFKLESASADEIAG